MKPVMYIDNDKLKKLLKDKKTWFGAVCLLFAAAVVIFIYKASTYSPGRQACPQVYCPPCATGAQSRDQGSWMKKALDSDSSPKKEAVKAAPKKEKIGGTHKVRQKFKKERQLKKDRDTRRLKKTPVDGGKVKVPEDDFPIKR